MIDLGEFTPEGSLGPARTMGELGRVATTLEQRAQAIEHMRTSPELGRDLSARMLVRWLHQDPSMLEVRFVREHVEGEPVLVVDRVTEIAENGAELEFSSAADLRMTKAEVGTLRERGDI